MTSNGSFVVTSVVVTLRIASIVIGVLCLLKFFPTVAAGLAIIVLWFVAKTRTRITAIATLNAMIGILEVVRQLGTDFAADITGRVAVIFIRMGTCAGLCSYLAEISANGTNLVFSCIGRAGGFCIRLPFISVSGLSGFAAARAIAFGIASVPVVAKRLLVSFNGVGGYTADGADLMQIFGLRARSVRLGYVITKAVLPSFNGFTAVVAKRAISCPRRVVRALKRLVAHAAGKFEIVGRIIGIVWRLAREVTAGNVTNSVAFVVVLMALCGGIARAGLLFGTTNGAKSVLDFSGGAGSAYFGFPIAEGMGDFSHVVAFCAVAGNIAAVGEVVADRLSVFLGFFRCTDRAASDENFGAIAGGSRFHRPSAKGVRIVARACANVAAHVTVIVVNVVRNRSRGTAEIAVCVAGVVINMGLRASDIAANVAVIITNSGINVVGNRSQRTANVAGSIASVGINVRRRNSVSTANVAVLITSVGIGMRRRPLCAAEVAVGITVGGVDVLRSRSLCVAAVAAGIAGAVIMVCVLIHLAQRSAYLAIRIAFGFIGMLSALARFAADVAFDIITIAVAMLCLGLACHAIAGVAGGVT